MKYQGDLIEAALRSEPIGRSGVTDLLFINYKAPDYTGHMYNMLSDWEGLILAEVDGHPVVARQGHILVAAFHPELTDDLRLHAMFMGLLSRESAAQAGSSSRAAK